MTTFITRDDPARAVVRVHPGGKADWIVADLPMEHTTQAAAEPRARLPA